MKYFLKDHLKYANAAVGLRYRRYTEKTFVFWLSAALLVFTVLPYPLSKTAYAAEDPEDCGSIQNAFGPFDYNDKVNREAGPKSRGVDRLQLVEGAHFNADVENLVRGISSVQPMDDIDYTLRAFPNHHRALHAMAKFYLKTGPDKKFGRYTADCWFDRAMRFQPTDALVRGIYGIFLDKKGNMDGALEQYKKALELSPNLVEAHYNIGLLYVKLKRYELANEHAVKAYQSGFPLPGLKLRLKKLGVWKDVE